MRVTLQLMATLLLAAAVLVPQTSAFGMRPCPGRCCANGRCFSVSSCSSQCTASTATCNCNSRLGHSEAGPAQSTTATTEQSWSEDPKSFVQFWNSEFATEFNNVVKAGPKPGDGAKLAKLANYTADAVVRFNQTGMVMGENGIAKVFDGMLASFNGAPLAFKTSFAIAIKGSNVIHETGVMSGGGTPAGAGGYYIRWEVTPDATAGYMGATAKLSADVAPVAATAAIAAGSNASDFGVAAPAEDRLALATVVAANANLAKLFAAKDYKGCAACYSVDSGTFAGGFPACANGTVLNTPADLTAFWTAFAATGVTGLKFVTTNVVADAAFTARSPTGVIHEVGVVAPLSIPYYVRWEATKSKHGETYTAKISSDISPILGAEVKPH